MSTSVATLSRIASTYAAGVLAPGQHQSLPIPVLRDGQLFVAYMYCRAQAHGPEDKLQVWPPSYVGYIDADQATFDRLTAVTPADFKQSDAADKPLGGCRTADEKASDEYLTSLARLYQALDALLPEFAAGAPIESDEMRAHAKEFTNRYPAVIETALRPYYEPLGRSFLDWLKA